MSKRNDAVAVRAGYDGQRQVILAKGAAEAAIAIVQSVQVLVRGHEYRRNLQEMVAALRADQTMRHADVHLLLEVVDRFKEDMTQETRDAYFLNILRLLEGTGAGSRLPPPP